MHFKNPSIDELAEKVRILGDRTNPRGLSTVELIGVSMEYRMGTYPTRKGMSTSLAEIEAAMILSGSFDIEAIKRASPNVDLSLFTEQAAYGPILAKQIPKLVSNLEKDPSTRRAVLYLGSAKTQLTDHAPCTNSLQVLARSGMLHLVVSMRSWDLVYGLPTDLATFNLVAQTIARHLDLLPGRVYVMAGSLHVYDKTAHKAISNVPALGITRVSMPNELKTWSDVLSSALKIVDGGETWLHAN